ncbi:hypothetical protein ARMGADRAFT_1088252 [Armillaria gallica]|uniref:Uncharacterized protein n=1 Tax=Armillaria gallica TaxID=47427 RepID=A0A2H3D5Z4_ARMGA|nr:hypothetical protein ARMGADRAFT_1088252 [Armillaria gallica]
MSAILPAEIIELVIHETWMLPLTNNERLTFMKASLRISSWWLLAFLQESFTDVYLVSPKYSFYLASLYRIREPFHILTINTSRLVLQSYLAHHCHSITLGHKRTEVHHARMVICNLPRCPKITMLFRNFAQNYPSWLITHVQSLFSTANKDGHLRLIFTYDTTAVDYSPRDRYSYASEHYFYPHDIFSTREMGRVLTPFIGVRRLEIKGANPCAVFMTVEACPDLEILETDVDENLIREGFNVANARPPASCPEEAYFFSKWNQDYPTVKMQWPNISDELANMVSGCR